jgi:hypothetical protein
MVIRSGSLVAARIGLLTSASAIALSLLTVATSSLAQDPAYAPAYPPGPAPTAPAPPGDDERTANNAVYFELLGNGGVYSINYERFLDDFGIRVGFSYVSIDTNNGVDGSSTKASLTTFPVVGSYYLGGKNNKLQLGLGATFFIVSAAESSINFAGNASGFLPVGTAVVGYRYMPAHGGFNFGIGFTPIFGPNAFLPWGGMQLGATF